jgi:hypothetical protein
MFLCVIYDIMLDQTPGEAILNGDQTGVHVILMSKYTWVPQGLKQVDLFGQDEKCQFMLMITTLCSVHSYQSKSYGKERLQDHCLLHIYERDGDM